MFRNCGAKILLIFLVLLPNAALVWAAPQQHAISFGQWMRVKLFVGPDEDKVEDMNVRTLNVDGRIKEFVTGDVHDVTDRVFVARRAYRLNDALPADRAKRPQWKWQRGGWVMVDRNTGRVSQLNLPDFDPFYSGASWYRDYVAYCGLTPGNDKLYAIVYQLGYRKPVLHEALGKAEIGNLPDTICALPAWQKQPARVTFQQVGKEKLSFAIHGRASELQVAQSEDETEKQ